jgi:hypothetical protein
MCRCCGLRPGDQRCRQWPPTDQRRSHRGFSPNRSYCQCLVAGSLTIVASVATVLVADRRAKHTRHREAHIVAAAEVLSALQNLNRKMINVAREGRPAKADADNVFWDDFHETATRWNSARYVAALYCSQEEFDILAELDAETDKLLELAMSKVWTVESFVRIANTSVSWLPAFERSQGRLGTAIDQHSVGLGVGPESVARLPATRP